MRANFHRIALRKQFADARQMQIADRRMNGLDLAGATCSRRPRTQVSAQRGNERPFPGASKPLSGRRNAIRTYIYEQPFKRLTVFVIHDAD